MKATIFLQYEIIGTADLVPGDISMGHIYGIFDPAENYYKYSKPILWQHGAHSNLSDKLLQLNVALDNGCFLFAQGGITIEDVPGENKRIDIAGVDSFIINDFFLESAPRPFVEEPWEAISIEQKILFEEELIRELGGGHRTWLNIFQREDKEHLLKGAEFAALCHSFQCDDVLFCIKKQGIDDKFAVVHLTWSGEKEKPGYPTCVLHEDFDHFKYYRMYPDKVDWEY